jgi:glycosyltransferase involved in cell wall biosynthesis
MISVVVITNNEERIVEACFESVKWADELIVIDKGSSDKTVEIAKKYTDKIFIKKTDDFSEKRNYAMEKASGDWVLFVDSDERVLLPLRDEIIKLIESTDKSAFAISRKNIIFGQAVNYGPYKKDWMIRLLKKSQFETWVGKVHEYAKFKGEMGYTKNSLLHLTHRDLDQFILKSLEWSKIDAQLRMDANHPKMTKWRFFRILITEFYEQGIKRRGFFNGSVGVIDSVLQVFFLYMSYVRLWQLQQNKPLREVYEEIDKKLQQNNFNYP